MGANQGARFSGKGQRRRKGKTSFRSSSCTSLRMPTQKSFVAAPSWAKTSRGPCAQLPTTRAFMRGTQIGAPKKNKLGLEESNQVRWKFRFSELIRLNPTINNSLRCPRTGLRSCFACKRGGGLLMSTCCSVWGMTALPRLTLRIGPRTATSGNYMDKFVMPPALAGSIQQSAVNRSDRQSAICQSLGLVAD